MIAKSRMFLSILITTLIISGCQQKTPTPATATIAAAAITTSTRLHTFTPTQSATAPAPTFTMTSSPPLTTSTPPKTGQLAIIFISETVPDQTQFKPGQAFQKSWTLKNGGQQAWREDFVLAVTASKPDGELLNSPQSIPLNQPVQPGETIQIIVDLVAPSQSGQYTVYYQLQDNMGRPVPDSQIWVTIIVCPEGQSCTQPNTVGSTQSNGISASLTDFTYHDQTTEINFCMDLPNRNYALDYAPSLLIDQKPAAFIQGGSSSPWNCMFMVYQASAAEIEQAEQITLAINASLRMSPPQGDPNLACESARQNLIAQYAGLDFQCQFSMAGYYTHLSIPNGLTREETDQIIKDTIEGAIYGPWVLTIK